MAKYYLLLALVGLISGMECRSLISTSLNEAIPTAMEAQRETRREFSTIPSVSKLFDDYTKNLTKIDREIAETSERLDNEEIRSFVAKQGLNLEKILANFAERTVDIKNYEERAAQWLELLKRMLQTISSGKTRLEDGRLNDVDENEKIIIDDDDDDERKFSINQYNWLGEFIDFLDEQSSDDNQSHVKSRYDNSSTLFSLIDENSVENKENDETYDNHDPEELENMLVGVRNEIDRIRRYFEKLCSKHHSMSSSKWQR